ncbi:MAG: threonine synthase [Proteobacteria bacterium]|nr:threonine synthase [Pseudomonadota bacterium]
MAWDSNLTAERPTYVTHLECSATGQEYPPDTLLGLSRAGKPLLVRYDLERMRREWSREAVEARPADLWRWRELLPVRRNEDIVSLGECETPIVPLPHAGPKVLVKDEGRLPTGSFKARGLAMAVSMAKALGVRRIAMPTNGNAGAALAAYASRCGIETIILCPEDTPEANVREIALQGGRVWRVNGLIDECGAIVAEGARQGRWFDFSTLKEPYRIEGKKTMGLELALQLGWRLPDAIFYPTGGGTGLIGMWKAFDELEALGWIGPERPRMYAVQAAGCAPIVRAFDQGADHAQRWEDAHTVAAGIRVPKAIGDFLILDAVRRSGGRAIAVDDAAIEAAVADAAGWDGLLLCPEGGATLAAYRSALKAGWVGAREEVVLFNCATGLKYPMPAVERFLDRHQPTDFDAL